MLSPFPYFGGKRSVASAVWGRLGWDVPGYVEPFLGSGAMLLGRPRWDPGRGWVETVNDLDGFVSNFWRAVKMDPQGVARHADYPCIENDLHARHAYLVEQRQHLQSRLEGDPDYYDARMAGWWVWGMSLWIGRGFCSGAGPWERVNRGTLEDPDYRRVHLGNTGMGVQRQLVHLGGTGRGVSRQRVHLGNTGGGRGDAGLGLLGLYAWMDALSMRLARVRVASGDWRRIVDSDAALGLAIVDRVAVFLDPPYGEAADRDMELYAVDSGEVAVEVREWCMEHGDDPRLRIALCGYRGEGHEALEARGWSRFDWSAGGGYAKLGGDGGENRNREAVWFSPHCLAGQTTLQAYASQHGPCPRECGTRLAAEEDYLP